MCGGGGVPRWYGAPIPVIVPGNVRVGADGDYVGPLCGGSFASVYDWLEDRAKINRASTRRQAGAVSLANIVTAHRHRKQILKSVKTPATSVASAFYSSAQMNAVPAIIAASSAAPGGRAPTNLTAGAMPFNNPPSGEQTRVLTFAHTNQGGQRASLLYDRIFDVVKTMSSTGTEAVTGVPTRYQGTTRGDEDFAGNNFLFPEIVATLGATAHNWTVCTYTDQNGNAGATLPSFAGISAGVVGRVDSNLTGTWFMPLASGDDGIQKLTQMQCSASVSGTLNFVMGHPLAWGMNLTATLDEIQDGILSAFDMERVFDDACLCQLQIMNSSSASSMRSFLKMVSITP